MRYQSIDDLESVIPKILEQLPYLKLLILFGSRARGDNDATSDWDFAVLYDEEMRKRYEQSGWDCYRGWGVLEQALKLSEAIDFIVLNDCSDILAHTVARNGKLIYEQTPGEFEAFRQRALKSAAELKRIHREEREKLELKLQKWGV
jgi:predicted nucleotidyltransferase